MRFSGVEINFRRLEHFDSAEVLTDLANLRQEHAVDVMQGLQPPPLIDGVRDVQIDSLVAYVN